MGSSTGAFLQCYLIFFVILSVAKQHNGLAFTIMNDHRVIGKEITFHGKVVTQYMGIPYARAPKGDLRFKKPVPVAYYSREFGAIDPPPACWQISEYPFPWYVPGLDKNEDCLYLNIWTPAESKSDRKAVIYFVHGGGFRFGSSKQEVYNGIPLAAFGDVVVVTVNYRLGPFGFLTTGTDDAPGNVGLYDILEGLKWVNQYITAFGGDPSKITIAGQDAGSVAVGLLSVSPLANGLFQRQIMESGSPAYNFEDSLQNNLKFSQMLAERVDCANETHTIQENPSSVLDCLRNINAEILSIASATINPRSSVTFVPQFGDDLLPTDPKEAIQNGNINCTELLIGTTLDEGSYQITTRHPAFYGFFGIKSPLFSKMQGKHMIQHIFKNFSDPDAVANHYLPSSISNDSYTTIRHQVYTSSGDATIVCPTEYYAEKCAAGGGDVYYYVWTHRPSNAPWALWMGIVHYSEVEFVFGTPMLHPFYFTTDEMNLSLEVIEIWSSFAKDGKPSVSWPLYSRDDPQVKYIGEEVMKDNATGFHMENCNFFRPYFGF